MGFLLFLKYISLSIYLNDMINMVCHNVSIIKTVVASFFFSHKNVFFGSDLVKHCLYLSLSSYRRCSRPLLLLGRLLLECVLLLVVLVA